MAEPVAVAGSAVPDPMPEADAADAGGDGSIVISGADDVDPAPVSEPEPEPAVEPMPEEPSVLMEDTLAATPVALVTKDEALSVSGFDVLPVMSETPLAADDAASDLSADLSGDAPVEEMASEPATPDVTLQAEGDALAEMSDDAGSDGPEAATEPETPAEPETLAGTAETGAASVAAAGAAAYAVDESVLAILREEAEREANARKSDAQVLETQTSLGLAPAGKKKKATVAKVEAKPAARRDLLPDVEEINSTLRPSEPEADADGLGKAASLPSPVRSGFRSGFLTVMTVAILCAVLYILSPRIGSAVPALADPLQSYVSFVDGLRLHLDGMMRSATVAINGG
ncbi:MAG: hypothetical protein NTW20_09365 [Rhodobacterales bacterium]|nr:hypothetical protein [Rhodobacterales bacterium]